MRKAANVGVFSQPKQEMVTKDRSLPGRLEPMDVPARHFVLDAPLVSPFREGLERAIFAMGCFWGAERIFFTTPGVFTTAVGYCGGFTPNPTYEEVCSGRTGHAESVLVVFDQATTSYAEMLSLFFEGHDPTQFMGQSNDIGTQYRSAIFTTSDHQALLANAARDKYQVLLSGAGFGPVVTEIEPASEFYYAEDYHQQYLAKNPNGYCGHGGTGVSCPVGIIST
jgi:peptide-methionine (S)-S-oxide reductase